MLTDALENALNRNLPRSPRARELLATLAGRRLGVHVSGLGRSFTVESAGHSLRIVMAAPQALDGVPDASVTGSPLALLALAGSDPEGVIRRGSVRIGGDAEVAQGFRQLAALLQPDLEEELSRLIGDAQAHQAARLARVAFGFGRRAAATAVRNVSEYLGHESRDLVPASEAESLFRSIEALREDVDRIEARLALLGPRARGAPRNSGATGTGGDA
jgi:ubiquinone biosynthesis protein UbiJ